MMSKEERIERGHQAQVAIEHPLVQEALNGLITTYEKSLWNTAIGDSVAREKLWHMRTAAVEFRAQFEAWIKEGRDALSEVQRAEEKAEKRVPELP